VQIILAGKEEGLLNWSKWIYVGNQEFGLCEGFGMGALLGKPKGRQVLHQGKS
jgi:hypothetical protein